MKLKKIIILSVAFCSLMTTQKVSALISDSQLSTLISEPSFRACVLDTYNSIFTDPSELPQFNLSLGKDHLAQITELECQNDGITSTEGIQYLTGLQKLDLGNNLVMSFQSNSISTIDLSKNTALTSLNLMGNDISTMDLSKNTKLTSLNLMDNDISTIDLSKNTALTYLNLSSNKLTAVDLSKNTALTKLSLSSNNISTIDLSKNIALTYLDLSSNNISTIDLSKNTALTSLYLISNKLTAIDLSKNTKLMSLYLNSNNFSQPTGTKYNLGKLTLGEKVSFKEYVKLPQGFKTKVSYTSSNPEIATVDENGNISGVKEGTTTITFTSKDKDGNLIYEVNEVTVTKKAVPESTTEKTNDDKTEVKNTEQKSVKNPETSDKGMIYGGGLTLTIGTIIAIRKKLKLLGI